MTTNPSTPQARSERVQHLAAQILGNHGASIPDYALGSIVADAHGTPNPETEPAEFAALCRDIQAAIDNSVVLVGIPVLHSDHGPGGHAVSLWPGPDYAPDLVLHIVTHGGRPLVGGGLYQRTDDAQERAEREYRQAELRLRPDTTLTFHWKPDPPQPGRHAPSRSLVVDHGNGPVLTAYCVTPITAHARLEPA